MKVLSGLALAVPNPPTDVTISAAVFGAIKVGAQAIVAAVDKALEPAAVVVRGTH